jgi:hypothetical protein
LYWFLLSVVDFLYLSLSRIPRIPHYPPSHTHRLKVDSLNRKYEKLLEAHRAAGGGEGPLLGPLEATIKSLKKEIQDLSEESLALQRDWLRDQTALVDSTAETEVTFFKE